MARFLALLPLLIALSAPALSAETKPPPPSDMGRWVTLPGADSEWSAIYTDSTAPTTHGAVVVIPDQEGHPDRPAFAHPLRTGLPAHGWATLALPAPPADQPGGLVDIGTRRLQAAIDYLRAREQERIVLLGHGIGATLSAAYLANQPSTSVSGLITVGWYDPEGAQGVLAATQAVAAIDVPIFDIYGSRDWDAVQRGAVDRRMAARREGRRYRQKRIEGADHDHTGLGHALTRRVHGWLHSTLVKGKP